MKLHGSGKFLRDGKPLILKGKSIRRCGFSGAGIPVGSIGAIAFLTMQEGMNPSPGGSRDFLAKVVRGVPATGFGQPKGTRWHA